MNAPQPENSRTRSRVRELLAAAAGPDMMRDGLADESDLFAAGVLDSFGMVMFLDVLTREFALQIPGEELKPENFASVAAIAALVERQAAQP
jgi:acyl carrier protein